DDSGVPGVGDPATDGMADWAGWAFTDKEWWTSEAGDQRRSEFTLGQGTVAVADPDEWDDAPHTGGSYNAYFSTPAIDISRSKAGSIQLKFDSSWRPEVTQTGTITVSYDGGDADEVLRWESEAGAYFKDHSTNETIVVDLDNPPGAQGMVLTFGLFDAGNNWWWAIDNIMVTGTPRLEMAYDPRPANLESDVCTKVILKWTPGAYAPPVNGHKLFFSQDFDDVKDGAAAADRGLTSDPEFDTAALPFTIDYETTYYWRIDEANTVSGWDEGSVWQFTTEPIAYPLRTDNITATASSSVAGRGPENTVNESDLDGDLHSKDTSTMWLSASEPAGAWIRYEFDRIYKLYEMWVWNFNGEGLLTMHGLKEVTIEYSTDGSAWTQLPGVGEFAKAPGNDGYAHDTPVAFGGAAAKYVKITANSNHSNGIIDQHGLSEVRFFYLPVQAKQPDPEDEAVGVAIDVTLSWSAGREAETHELYFSDDEQAVTDGSVSPVTLPGGGCGSSYGPLSLDLGKTYYWKVVEVNNAEEPNTWEGDVWSFSTPDYLVVEDFEGYSDDSGDEVFATWLDGFDVATNGSQIGYFPAVPPDDPHYLEQTIVHGGSWSAPLYYDNTGTVVNSEVTRTFSSPQDWTVRGIRALTLFFYGQAGNTTPGAGEQMYVKLNGVKVAYDGDMADITQEQWHQWDIDLASFGVNLQNVTKISIGFDRGASSALGLVYFDDIRLYPPQCILSRRSADFAAFDYAGGDCVIDYRELEVMAADWLVTDYAIATTAPTVGPSGWWKFDDNADDSSGSGIHGTAWGNPQYVSGQINNAMQFDGNTHVVLGTAFDLNFGESTDFTVALWVKTTGWDEDAAIISNKDWNSGGNTGWAIAGQWGAGYGEWQWNYCDETGGRVDYDDGAIIYDGQWHHLCVSHDRDGYATFYFEGEYQAQRDISGSTGTIDASYPTVVGTGGAEGLVWAYWFVGLIDDVRIYSYVLSGAEVAYLADITPGDGQLYFPVPSAGNLYDPEPPLSRSVNSRDFALLADEWLDKQLWP
ncbi:MAG: discoidin domain-containing protein, partial [Planctomycetes bacterium]|nr:discoidin domain-containing protein [Planctomycetota bacterium]